MANIPNQNVQLPRYRPEQREMNAPPGSAPYPAGPNTQRNNAGPVGFGQPNKRIAMAVNPSGPRQGAGSPAAPAPPELGTGDPRALYPEPVDPVENAKRDIWANRNSRPAGQLIQQAYAALLGRQPAPGEAEHLMSQAPSTDALVQILLQLKPQPQPQAPQGPGLQSAILGI